ncbi:MAG: hypothetical protein N3D16_01030 [Anaerolineales bacterium]|nr:hypothetical protein [Anaerolineales bacterium]
MGQAELTKVRVRNPKVSEAFAAVIEKALEVKPEDRYANAQQFKEALLESQRIREGVAHLRVPEQPSTTRPKFLLKAENEENPSQSLTFPAVLTKRWFYLPFWVWGVGALLLIGFATWFLSGETLSPARASLPAGTTQPFSFVATQTQTLSITRNQPTATVSFANTPTVTLFPTLTPFVGEVPNETPIPQPSPTPFGGSQGQIAFASNRSGKNQVWLMNLDGSGLTQLTDIPEGACQPNFSPDGMRLVFISPCSEDKESYPGAGLFFINVDGTNLTPLPSVPGGDYDPAWSPDGNWIAFTSLRITNWPRIYLMNVQTLEVKRLSEDFSRDFQPSWSADGKKIVFVSRRQGPTDLWVMNSDGSEQQRLTLSGTKINTSPKWSPDGKLIVFTQALRPGQITRLAVFSSSEGKAVEYGFELGFIPVRDPVFSPDGLWLLFTSWPTGRNHDIYMIAANGAGKTQITDFPSKEFDPTWRPMVP